MITTEVKEQYVVNDQDTIFVVTTTIVKQDGNVIGKSKNRKPIFPGSDYSEESPATQKLCASLHVPTSIARYQARNDLSSAIDDSKGEATISELQSQVDAADQAHEQYLLVK